MVRRLTLGALITRVALSNTAPKVPLIVAVVVRDTGKVVIVKFTVLAPAGTVAKAGTVASALFDAMLTRVPPTGAGPFKVTVPTDEFPPVTAGGATNKPIRAAGLIVRVVEADPPRVPLIVAVAVLATADVLIVKFTDSCPAATVTLAGTVALGLVEDRITTAPFGPAAPFNVAVPVEGVPPMTELGDTETLAMLAVTIVSVAVWVMPFDFAVIVTVS